MNEIPIELEVHRQLLHLCNRLVLPLLEAVPHDVVGGLRVVTAENPCVFNFELLLGEIKLRFGPEHERKGRCEHDMISLVDYDGNEEQARCFENCVR